MIVEGADVVKSPIRYDEFDTPNNKLNSRNYNERKDISKSSLVSDDLNTLRMDLSNATKSLEKSLSIAEGLKVNELFNECFIIFNVSLKESLRNVAVDKQVLAMRLQESQRGNEKLRRQITEQRKDFRNTTNQMQYEIDEIKNALAATKVF